MAVKTFEVKGLKELGQKLKTLDVQVQKKIARAGTNAAAQVIKKRIIQQAPVAAEAYKVEDVVVQPRNIQRNVVVRYLKPGISQHTSEHIITVRHKRQYGFALRVASLQEFGDAAQGAKPFFRPAFNEAAEDANTAFKKRFQKRIEAEIQKLAVR